MNSGVNMDNLKIELSLGEITKKAELLETDFLREMGVDVLGKYNEIESHVNKMINVLVGEDAELTEIDAESIYEMEQELDDKTDAIDSASCTLANMKKIVNSMKKSDLKTTLISYIEDMETDLC